MQAGIQTGIIERAVLKANKQHLQQKTDKLAVEEPLEIQLVFGPSDNRTQESIAITMRTPGNDIELAVGFLFAEGIVTDKNNIASIDHCGPVLANGARNVIKIELVEDIEVQLKNRYFAVSSSCGVCGKSSIEATRFKAAYPSADNTFVKKHLLFILPDKIDAEQTVFQQTGGIHAAACFDLNGNLLNLFEDVGRHNAFDKLIGHALLNNQLPLSQNIALMSGRLSFELVQKAVMAGIPILAAVGAPSSLAFELAEEHGVTLVGFMRNDRFNIYTNQHRILSENEITN